MPFTANDLTELEAPRRELPRAQATLRDADDALDRLRVRATDDVLAALGDGDRDAGWKALGANETARAHRLSVELARHEGLQQQARIARQARARVEDLDAQTHALADRRRFSEWERRDAIARSLLGRGAGLLDLDEIAGGVPAS